MIFSVLTCNIRVGLFLSPREPCLAYYAITLQGAAGHVNSLWACHHLVLAAQPYSYLLLGSLLWQLCPYPGVQGRLKLDINRPLPLAQEQ